MKCMKQQLFVFVALLLLNYILCDIPVHCVKSQIEGQWLIHATKAKLRNDLYKFTCGHKLPSKEAHAFLVKPNKSFRIIHKIHLKSNDEAILLSNGKEKKGKWTMVYNEGFDIQVGSTSFFAFSKYAKNDHRNRSINTRWVSKCYSTLVGWYHIGPKKWGCFYATKIGHSPDQVTNGEPKGKLVVVANTVKLVNNHSPMNRFKSFNMRKQQLPNKFDEANSIIDSLDYDLSFIQNKETVFLEKGFKNHQIYVDRVKNLTDLWEATNYDEFSKMTLEELNNYAGRRKVGRKNFRNDFDIKNILIKPSINTLNGPQKYRFRSLLTERDYKYPEFPKTHNTDKKFMFSARNQGSCGSCYAMATLSMLEARIRRLTRNKIKERLSVQHVLSCSVYNQGCGGGYAYLVLKFAKEIELLPEKCMKYKSKDKKCSSRCDREKLNRVYSVKDYKYIGGSYGKCTEYEIMKEVMLNGPIVVSFEPDYLFMHYRKGIYKSIGNTWLTRNEAKPQWVKVDHSVVLVGWGYDEEKRTPYWILQNSWGKNWGEGGYFRMVRGIDHMGIESICESGIPIIRNIKN